MIVFDLQCEDGQHRFEGWFGSSADYADQQQRGLLTCPICASTHVVKAAMAPSVGKKSNQQTSVPSPAGEGREQASGPAVSNAVETPTEHQEALGKIAEVQQALLADSEWVGDKFADRARDIHYGDAEEKLIHGTATREDVADLTEEGIAALPLPIPVVPPKSKN